MAVALVAASASLAVAVISQISTRKNQAAIEELRDRLGREKAERDAKRDYEYEARKRLYEQCGPILFQLVEHCEAAYFRIVGLAENAKSGNLEPDDEECFLRDEYYRTSTLYRFLAPCATLKLLQRSITSVDLSLDALIWRQYTLARQAFFAFGAEFTLAKTNPMIDYDPFDADADRKAKANPERYYRQGLPLGVMESAIEALLISDNGRMRLMTYAECEAAYAKKTSSVRKQFDEISFLIDEFHPRSRPIFWRILVTQACLYRGIFEQSELKREDWELAKLAIPGNERPKFDWRSLKDEHVTNEAVFIPLDVAQTYLENRLTVALKRIAAT
ncbi:hypothetical protein N2603_18950 [Bradyrhizobium huanghuaihaiense]|uniref:hypothetical protein n=1 Tax=Bradyrhizobium huanghuaihaiense TaxID=990078 RepID=UPI0021AA2699|nr:hypothetical protein [Bradyrhizobium sp. CB3035]UWU80467.1 hypothetical protein N2603_18950 [Bradyrhizobium sp. CB3035]